MLTVLRNTTTPRRLSRPPPQARKEEKARLAAEREAARTAKEYTKMRRLGIGKAAGGGMAAEDAALYTAGEVKRREIKARGGDGGCEPSQLRRACSKAQACK